MHESLTKLGHRIAKLRTQKGWTQEKLAELINYSPNHLSKIESARTQPSFELLVMLSKVFDVSLKDLFNFDEYDDSKVIKENFQKILRSGDNQKLSLLYKIYNSIFN